MEEDLGAPIERSSSGTPIPPPSSPPPTHKRPRDDADESTGDDAARADRAKAARVSPLEEGERGEAAAEAALWEGPLDEGALQALVDATRQSPRYAAMYGAIPSPAASTSGSKQGGASQQGWLHTAALRADGARVFGLDCEMVMCGEHGPALARVSLVERMEGGTTRVVMDEWVRPAHAVTDHLTAVSGVTAERLDAATHTLATVQDALLTAVGVRDVLVGHSLATDLKAVRVAHARVVDTALLCGVTALPRWTLGLRDVVRELFCCEASRLFQSQGCSHDSVADAQWAVRVAACLARRHYSGMRPSLELPTVPERFLSHLQLKGLPRDATDELVRSALLGAGVPPLPADCQLRVKAAHCFAVMEYARPSDATAAFDAVMDAPWCEDDGFLCRWLPPAPKNPAEAMWLKSYRRVDRSVRLRGTLDRTLVGKVIGKGGRRLREIRKRCGAMVKVHSGGGGGGKKAGGAADDLVVEIEGATRALVDAALELVQQVASGDPVHLLGF